MEPKYKYKSESANSVSKSSHYFDYLKVVFNGIDHLENTMRMG